MQHVELSTNNLQALIDGCGLSCDTIAKVTGVSVESMYKYTAGRATFGIKNAILLADFFAVPLDYLVGRCDEETTKHIQENYGRYFMELRRAPYEAYLTGRKGYVNKMLLKEPTGESPWPYNIVSEVGADIYSGAKMEVDFIITREHEEKILEIIGQLKPQHSEYLLMLFRDGMTQSQIAEKVGLTQQRVCEVIRRGLWCLRRHSLKKWFLYGEEYYRENNALALRAQYLRQEEIRLDAWAKNLERKREILGAPRNTF